jgi:hypothetical protein
METCGPADDGAETVPGALPGARSLVEMADVYPVKGLRLFFGPY